MGWSAFTFKYIKPAENIHTTNLGLFLAYPYVWYWIITWLHQCVLPQMCNTSTWPAHLAGFRASNREGDLRYTATMEMLLRYRAEGMGKGISTTQPLWRWWLWCPADRRLHPNLTGNLSSTCRDQIQWQFWWPQMTYLSSASDDFCLASWARLPSVM